MIFCITVGLGMLLFQILIWQEAMLQFLKNLNRDLNIQWFVLPRVERSYMRRQPGVMTVENDPSIWAEIIQND